MHICTISIRTHVSCDSIAWKTIAAAARSWTLPTDLLFHCPLASNHAVTTETQRQNNCPLSTVHRDKADPITGESLGQRHSSPYLGNTIAKSLHIEDHGAYEIRGLPGYQQRKSTGQIAVAKSTCCSSKGTEFSSQHPHQRAPRYLALFSGLF